LDNRRKVTNFVGKIKIEVRIGDCLENEEDVRMIENGTGEWTGAG